jgi:hypothetical protein
MRPMFHKLIAPACAVAALTFSSTALAGEDPASEPVASDAETETVAQVESSEPVTLETETAAAAEVTDRLTKGGRFSLGAARTLAGLNGINARFYITDHFHLGVNIGVATFSYREPDLAGDAIDCSTDQTAGACTKTMRTLAYIGSSLEGIYWILGKPGGNLPFQADFGIGGRLGFQHLVNGTDIAVNLDDPLQFTLEIPLILMLNLGENFSIAPEFGAVFRWNPGTRLANNTVMPPELGDSNPGFPGAQPGVPTTGPGFGFEITDGIGLFGGATILYAF